VADRRDEIVDRTFEPLDEGGRHPLSAGGHVDRRRLQRQARGHFGHSWIDGDDGLPLAVDRDLELFTRRRSAEQEPVGVAMQIHPEDVVAVGRKRMHHREAAARPERRAVGARELRGGLGHAVVRLARGGVGIADRERTRLARRAQVPLHQRRRERLNVRDVVEALADRVGRQERGGIDVDREQVSDRPGVFGPVEALEWPSARIRIEGGRGVDPGLERARERREDCRVGPARSGGRHHAGTKLPDDFLRHRRLGVGGGHIEGRQRQPAALRPIVMTRRAVLLHHRGVRRVGARFLRECHCRDTQTQKTEAGRGHRKFPHLAISIRS
jgi:hypothetical protein